MSRKALLLIFFVLTLGLLICPNTEAQAQSLAAFSVSTSVSGTAGSDTVEITKNIIVPTDVCFVFTNHSASMTTTSDLAARYLGVAAPPYYGTYLNAYSRTKTLSASSQYTLYSNFDVCFSIKYGTYTGSYTASGNKYLMDVNDFNGFSINNGNLMLSWDAVDPSYTLFTNKVQYRIWNKTNNSYSGWLTPGTTSWEDSNVTGGIQYQYDIQYTTNTSTGFATLSLPAVTYDSQAPTGDITLPDYSTSSTVTITNNGSDNVGVTDVRYSLDGITWGDWEAYASQKSYTLPGEGAYNIYVQFRDLMGNTSPEGIYDSVTVDLTNPTGSIATASGTAFVNATANLILAASDNNAVSNMRISLNSDFSGSAWQAYNGSGSIAVTGADGPYTIYVKYKDIAGNESEAYSLAITKDTVGPSDCTIELQGKEGIAGETSSQAITVIATGSDANGLYGIEVSSDNSSWTPMCTTLVGSDYQYVGYLLPEGRGTKTVYVRIYDTAGNFSLVSDTIVYNEDTIIPTCSLTLTGSDGSSLYTVNPIISVKVTANDNATFNTALQIRLSNDGLHWSSYAPFSSSFSWNLVTDAGGSVTEGEKTVYLNVKDEAGNVGYAIANISYSLAKPTVNQTQLEQLVSSINDSNINTVPGLYNGEEVLFTNSNVVYVPLPFSGAAYYRTAVAGAAYGEWEVFNGTVAQKIQLGLGEGIVEVRVQSKDANGAISDEYVFKFVVDRTAPVIKSITGLNGATATKTENVTLFASVVDNCAGTLYFRYSLNGGAYTGESALGTSGQTNQFTVTGLVSGVNNILIDILDASGNFSTTQTTMFRI